MKTAVLEQRPSDFPSIEAGSDLVEIAIQARAIIGNSLSTDQAKARLLGEIKGCDRVVVVAVRLDLALSELIRVISYNSVSYIKMMSGEMACAAIYGPWGWLRL